LTDPKRGYKSIIKKKDKFIFKEIWSVPRDFYIEITLLACIEPKLMI
jgi:hypothetical protein